MATMNDFSLPVRLFLKGYRWRRIDPVPWTPLRRPLAESRLALVSSAGFILPGQEPFKTSLAGDGASICSCVSPASFIFRIWSTVQLAFFTTGWASGAKDAGHQVAHPIRPELRSR
ncbi:MAG TPA: hypothetical protein VGP73_14825 [Thermoanaerobaculia bacterium]